MSPDGDESLRPGPGRRGKASDPPIVKVEKWLEAWKGVLVILTGTVIAIGVAGWRTKDYVDGFETKADAAARQATNDHAHEELRESTTAQNTQLEGLQIYSVRVELQQRNDNDRLECSLQLQTAESARDRREARDCVEDANRRIARRHRILGDDRALRQLAKKVRESPVDALDGL